MLKKLKSLFIVEEGGDTKGKSGKSSPKEANLSDLERAIKQSEQKQASASTAKPASSAPSKEAPILAASGKPNEKFVDKLLGAIESNNLEGFDYLEYKQSLQSLSKVDMDEATRYQSAMAMAKTMGANENKIFDAAQHYLNILKEEQQKFEVAFKAQESKQVSFREEKIKTSEDQIKQKTAQIEQLKKEIAKLESELSSVKNDANQANAKVQATKQGFYNAYHSVVDQIKADVQAMQKYLK